MFDLLLQHASTLVSVAALLIAAVALTARWEAFSLWLLSTWHALPLIGGIAWLARRQSPRRSAATGQSGLSAMVALCSSYARYIRVLSRGEYENCMNYLRKAGDLGRSPFPALLWFVIFSMVIIEAVGFAYVLAGWTLPGASEVLQQAAAGAIGFLVAVILVFFTHWAGVEIYQSNQHRRDRREWIEAGRTRPLHGPDLSLNDPQSVDDREPAYVQRATRGPGKTTYLLTFVTLVMVGSIGFGAAYVRGQVLEQELVVEAAQRTRALDRFDLGLAPQAAQERIAADRRAIEDEIAIKRKGGWGTLVVLVIIFTFLQLLGMFFGYRYCFNGRLSRDAYRALHADRFSSYSELVQYYDRIADIAQSRLEQLQQRLERRHSGLAGSLSVAHYYTFRDYLQMRETQRRDKPIGGEPEPEPIAAPLMAAPQVVAQIALAPAAPEPAGAAPAPADASVASVEESPAAIAVHGAPMQEPPGVAESAGPVVADVIGPPARNKNPLGPVLKNRSRAAKAPEPALDLLPVDNAAPATLDGVTENEPAVDAARILDEAEALERKRAAERTRLATKGAASGRGSRESEARE